MNDRDDVLFWTGFMIVLIEVARDYFIWEMWGRAERKAQILWEEQADCPR